MYDYVHEEEIIGEYRIEIRNDPDPQEPFDEDLLPTWGIDLSNHRDYKSPTYGAAMPISMEVAMTGEGEDMWDRMQFFKNYHVLGIYMYDHSGRTIRASGGGNPFSCPWDSGMAGFVYVSKADFRESGYYGVKKSWPAAKREELADKFLKSMVQQLDDHMTGNIWGYVVSKAEVEDPDEDDWEEVESCWGFVGDPEYCMSEAKDVVKYLQEKDAEEEREERKRRLLKLRIMIENKVPLHVREMRLSMA